MSASVRTSIGSVIVVASSTPSRKYSQYIQAWIRAWTLYGEAHSVDIQPKVLVPHQDGAAKGHIGRAFINFEPDTTSPLPYQTQVNRLLASRWLDCPDSTTVFTADIDMFPGTDDFFVRLLRSTPADSFVVARNVLSHLEQFPICYLSASAQTWRSAFEGVKSADIWESWADPEDPSLDWFIDQRFAYFQLERFSLDAGRHLTLWDDGASGHSRLDRAHGGLRELLRAITTDFSDYHAHRSIYWRIIASVIQWRLKRLAALRRKALVNTL